MITADAPARPVVPAPRAAAVLAGRGGGAPPAPAAGAPAPTAPPAPRTFLPEVQALRALAVLLVVVYHLWPRRLTGGFVGVDVFFVISGFLITSHLYREVRSTGRVRLAAFYARRARRLLPAALTVLVASVVGTVLLLPVTRWESVAGDVLASTFYVQNWVLADRAVDYSAAQSAASVAQHFWSLSVEEQFYLLWPPLVLLVLALARRATPAGRDVALLVGLGAVSVASLGWSVHATATDPAAAYFVTPTRIWELGAGALLALAVAARSARFPGRPPAGERVRTLVRWAGLAAIAYAAWTYSSATAFPGTYALVPVLGTVAVIAAGDTGPRDPSSEFFHLRSVQFLGSVSYSLYLWHWPAIVFAPFALGHPMGDRSKVALLVACCVLAWATKVLVEDRTQGWPRLARPRSVAVLTAAAMLAVTAVAGLQWGEVQRREAAARAALVEARTDPCFGAAARAPGASGCGDPFGSPAWLLPLPEDRPWYEEPACTKTADLVPVARCRFGPGEPTRTVALVGDSHAEHWRGAIHRLARELDWEVVEVLRGACPATTAEVLTFRGQPIDPQPCREWNDAVGRMLDEERPDAVFTSSWAGAMSFDGEERDGLSAGATGFAETWEQWAAGGAQVVVLRDVPTTGGRNMPECLLAHPDEPRACSSPREQVLLPDAMTEAAAHLGPDRVRLVDVSDVVCDEVTCHPVIGGAAVYYDRDHLAGPFSWSLGPVLLDRLGGRDAI